MALNGFKGGIADSLEHVKRPKMITQTKALPKIVLASFVCFATYVVLAISVGVIRDDLVCNVTAKFLKSDEMKNVLVTLERWRWWARIFRSDKAVEVSLIGPTPPLSLYYVGNYVGDSYVVAQAPASPDANFSLDLRLGFLVVMNSSVIYEGYCKKSFL